MRILLAWDDANEAELLCLYMNAGDHEAMLAQTPAEALALARAERWDVVLMSLTLPTIEEGSALFQSLQQARPLLPIVIACRPDEMIHLARFMVRGLRFYLMRDTGGDFVFLVISSLESAVAATRAEESRKLADRLREEMDGVRRLQETIIPSGLKPPPGYRVAARYEPSEISVVGDRPVVMAGGDYYDLFRPDDHTLVILIGDASGHGLKACMSIMTMHTLVRMIGGKGYYDTATFVAEINQRLCENSIVQSGGGFITLYYAAIDTITHKMYWTSAGHPLPLLYKLETDEVLETGTSADGGMPLGIMPDVEYSSGILDVPPNSRMLLYTDGLPEAFPVEAEGFNAFGVDGMAAALRASRGSDPEGALEYLFRESNKFTGGSGRHDDTSAVLLDRLP